MRNVLRMVCFFAICAMMSSCFISNKVNKNSDIDVVKEKKKTVVKNAKLVSDLVEFPQLKTSDKDLKTYKEFNKKSNISRVIKQTPFYEYYFKKQDKSEVLAMSEDGQMSFDAMPILDFISVFSKVLEFNFVIDPVVSGSVTMSVETDMSREDLWKTFEQVLWLSGAYCSLKDDTVHIYPFSKMPKEHLLFRNTTPRANVEVALIQIKHGSSNEIITQLTDFLTEGALAIEIESQNSILIVESPSNLLKLRELISLLDKKSRANWAHRVYPCVNVSATRIMNELSQILPILGFPVSLDITKPEPGAIHLTSLDRLQIIVASAANDEALEESKRWVVILDKDDIGDQEQLFIYQIRNGKAGELSQAVGLLFNTRSALLTANNTTDSKVSKPSSNATVSKKVSEDGVASIFDVPVTLFADGVHNRLLFKTTSRVYTRIKALLDRIDTASTQVLLQIMVSEITLSDNSEYGVELGYDTSGKSSNKSGMGFYDTVSRTNYANLDSSDALSYGGSYLLSDPNNASRFAYIRALVGEGRAVVLSSPQIVVKNNSEAMVSVGNKVPIVTSENSDTSSGTVINRDIQYEETGTILTITPQLTTEGLVKINLKQEVSSAVANTSSGIDSPIIQKRVLTTELSFEDGQTVMVGGLRSKQETETKNNIPIIKDIPLIGELFGYTSKGISNTELIILITGKIITNKTKQEELMDRFRNAVNEIEKLEEEIKQCK